MAIMKSTSVLHKKMRLMVMVIERIRRSSPSSCICKFELILIALVIVDSNWLPCFKMLTARMRKLAPVRHPTFSEKLETMDSEDLSEEALQNNIT